MSPTITTVLSDSDGQEGGLVSFGNTDILTRFSDSKKLEEIRPQENILTDYQENINEVPD